MSVTVNQPQVFGKVYQIDDSQHLDTLIQDTGHSLSSGMQYTFMPSESGSSIFIHRVNDEDSANGKNNDYIIETGYTPVALKSTYNTEAALETFLTDNSISSIGTMLKRVNATDKNSTINLDDADFEAPYDPSSELYVKHADKSVWQDQHVWSIDADAFDTGFPDVSGYWMADQENAAGEGATFTKVVSDGNGGFIPDINHTPIHYASDQIHSTTFTLVDQNGNSQSYNVQDIATRLNTNWTNSQIDHNTSYHDSFKKPPVNDTGSTLIDGVTPIYKDENSGSEDLYIKIGDHFLNVRSDGETYSTSSGTKNLSALETAPISSLQVENNDWTFIPLSDVFEKMSGVVQPIDKLSVDIVVPLSDKFDYGEGYDNRTASGSQINSLAFVPGENLNVFENIFVSFENDFDGDLDKLSFKFTDGHYHSTGGGYDSITEDYYYNLVGNFQDLTNGGSLDIYLADGWSDANSDGYYNTGEEIYNPELGTTMVGGVPVPQAYSLGTSVNSTGGIVTLPGGINGYTAGPGNDYIMMNVSAISSYSGEYIGGDGWDYLDIKNDAGGMIVDFLSGNSGDLNSAFVTWSDGGNTGFMMSEFEALFLSHGNDVALIGAGVGEGLTDKFDTEHLIGSQSMFRLETGNAEWDSVNNQLGTDYLYVNSDSNIYLSFNFAYDGVKATFNEDSSTGEQSATISNNSVNTFVDETGGTGQLVDAIKTTGYNDIVINNGSTGVVVDLGGTKYEWENSSESDTFIGSVSSNYDVLDAREAFDFTFDQTTINNPDTSETLEGVKVVGTSEIENVINADLVNVDYIMVRDARGDLGSITDDDLIWDSMTTADVDFYKDMSDIYGQYQIEGLGSLTSDSYGQGYDVQTSASVENFGGETKRIFYDGDHSDFVDTTDRMSGEEGVFNMQLDTSGLDSGVDPYAIGSNWAKEVEDSNPNGGEGSFYIVVGGKKVAVAHDGSGWKVDNTALFIAENASASITGPASGIGAFTQNVADRYNIEHDGTDGTITNDIYLNATEQQIDEVLASPNGLVSSAQAFNFGFYTQFQIGETILNIKLQQDTPPSEDVIAVNSLLGDITGNIVVRGDQGSYELYNVTGDGSTTPFEVGSHIAKDTSAIVPQNIIDWKAAGYQGQVHYPAEFSVNENDIDLMVESVFNRVETDGAGVSSGGEVGNFVKVDDIDDVALGNGGNDTYVIESSTMGTALEYGDINETTGGLENSNADSVNFSGISSAADLNFTRSSIRNEASDSTLIINDGAAASNTALFDNYNTYFDFRRIEYLTVDDAANNDEIFEIAIGDNSSTDGVGTDLEWDNEIVVSGSANNEMYADGGIDILVGKDGIMNVFNLENVTAGSEVHIKDFSGGVLTPSADLTTGISTEDDVKMNIAWDLTGNTDKTDGVIEVVMNATESFTIYTDAEDEQLILDNMIFSAV